MDIEALQATLRSFAAERDWQPFHTPKNLSTALMVEAAERLGWSARSLHRMLKVARSVADLAGSETLGVAHVAEAMQYRRGLPAAG